MPPTVRPPPPVSPGGRSLRTNMLHALLGMGVFHACQFGVIILLAKFAPPEVLGQVRFSLAVATPIIVFCSLELRGALVADAAQEFTFGTYRRLRSITSIIAGTILAGIAVWEVLTEEYLAFALIFAGMCGSKLLLALAEIGWGLFQKRERLDLMGFSAAIRGLAMLISFAVLVPLYAWLHERGTLPAMRIADGAAWAIAIYVIASAAILIFFDRRRIAARADFDPGWHRAALWQLARQTFPLGIVLLLVHLCNSVPELVIAQQRDGKAALGFFGALATVTIAANVLLFQAINAAANRLSYYYQTDVRHFLTLAAKLLALAGGFGAVALVVAFLPGEWLLTVLYRPAYAAYYTEFLIIIVAQCLALLTVVLGVLTTQMRLFWLQVPAQVTILVATLIAAFLLIPTADDPVRGGALTVLARSVVHFVLYTGCCLFGILARDRVLSSRVSLGRTPPPPAESGDMS